MNGRIDWLDDPDAPEPTSLVPAVTALVINDDGKILLIRHTDNGLYAVPGGAMEPGESLPDAAIRETREETGIDIAITAIGGTFSYPGHVIEYTSNGEVRQELSILYVGHPTGGEPTTSSESTEVLWATPDQINQLPMHPRMRFRITHWLTHHTPHIG